VVASRVCDFVLVDEMNVVANRGIHAENESGY